MRAKRRFRRGAVAILSLCLVLFAVPQARAQDDGGAALTRAVALMNDGSVAEALPLLERLVSRAPRNVPARFALAEALFRLGRDARARYHLELLRGGTLGAQDRRLIDGRIAQLDARRVWQAYFSLNIRPESNGTRQTSDGAITIGGVPFTLNEAAIGRPSTSVIVQSGIALTPPVAENTRARLSLDGYFRLNDNDRLRDTVLTFRAGLSHAPAPGRSGAAGCSWRRGTRAGGTIPTASGFTRRTGDRWGPARHSTPRQSICASSAPKGRATAPAASSPRASATRRAATRCSASPGCWNAPQAPNAVWRGTGRPSASRPRGPSRAG